MSRVIVARCLGRSFRTTLMIMALFPLQAHADGVLEREECGICHRLEVPSEDERSVEAFAERRGPDLFYAGSKYRPEWLRAWLIAPDRIRPAGLAPYRHAKTVDGKDQIDATGLRDHVKVAPSDVDAVVSALVALDWGSERLGESLPVAPPVPRMLAEMNFVKFKGCASCHRVGPELGGVSGPQLYGAMERLRPEFLASYISDPQVWDPVAPMPGYGLPDVEVAKLIRYLQLLNEEREHESSH